MANGISKTGKNMTQQQKVMARYGAIMEQTTKAQGDMARTMDSPANQLRVLKARMDEAKIALGTALQPAMISVLPVLTGLANGAAGVIKSMTGMSESGDDVVLSFSEAQKILDKTVGTKFGDIAKKIETASAKTDDAISNFRTAARATKSVYLDISLEEPTTTGRERIDKAIEALKALVPKTVKTDPVEAKIDAIMKDGKVTEKEKDGLAKWLNTWSKNAINQIKIDEKNKIKAIDAQIKAGKITQAEGADLKAAVTKAAEEAIGQVTATVDTVNAEIGAGEQSMTTVTLAPDQVTALANSITAQLDAETVAVNAKIDEVMATFDESGTVGLVVGTLYKQIGEEIAKENARIKAEVAKWTKGLAPTPEQVKDVMDAIAKNNELFARLNGEVSFEASMAVDLDNLTLDLKSIENYFKAAKDKIRQEVGAIEDRYIKQVDLAKLGNEFPEYWSAIAESIGVAGLTVDQAIEVFRQQKDKLIAETNDTAAFEAIKKLSKSIKDQIEGEDVKLAIKATMDTLTFINSLDLDNLGTETKKALLETLQSIEFPEGTSLNVFGNIFGGENPFKAIIDKLIEDLNTETSKTDAETAAGKISDAAETGIAADGATQGAALVDTFNAAITGKEEETGTAAGKISTKAEESLKPDGTPSGTNFTQGFIDGMKSKEEELKTAAAALGAAAEAALKGSLKEASPSKVAMKSGLFFGEGFAIGIEDSAMQAIRSAGLLGDAAANALNPSAGFALNQGSIPDARQGAGNLTIELNVDGERLGRASIKAINGVLSRSGRALIKT